MKNLMTLFFCFAYLHLAPLTAQSSSGTEFWLAYMENLTLAFNDQPVFAIQISSEFSTTGSISVPATGFTQPFTVNAGDQIEVLLPTAIWYSETSEVIEGKGIKITSDDPIEVSATHFRIYFTEATGVLPVTELTDEYLTTCYFQPGAIHPSSFVVVATADDTEVEITPTAFTLGLHPMDVPFTITMQEGEIYQVQSLGDLTGSRVHAVNGEKLAVFSGAQQSFVGDNCTGSADNHLYEQTQPFTNWSDLYYFVPFKNQGGDVVRILAKNDDTEVYFDCNLTVVLQAGEFYQAKINQPTVISSTAPISLTQLNESQECNASGLGDPNMLTLLPTRNQGIRVSWRATPGTTGSLAVLNNHFTNIIMNTADVVLLELDGNSISDQFVPFPANPAVSYAQITVGQGDHVLSAIAPFHCYHYGFGDYDAYTKTGSFQQVVDLEFVCLEIEADGVFCVDSLIQWSAVSNFEIVNYNWQTSDGQSASVAQPGFTFPAAGEYTITLIADNADGESLTATYDLTIFDCPDDPCGQVVFLTIEATGDCANEATLFSYNSTLPFENVEWDFGDGSSISTENSPSHIYSTGVYNITFTGYDAFNCPYSQTLNFEVVDCDGCGDPNLTIFIEGDLCAGESLDFSANFPPDVLDFIFWQTSNGLNADIQAPVFVFNDPGIYTVTLEAINVFDNCFYSGNLEFEIEDCTDPCDDFVINNIDVEGEFCVFTSLVFTADLSEPAVSYAWVSNGITFSQWDSLAIIYLDEADIELVLTVTNADGCVATQTIFFEITDCVDPCLDLLPISINAESPVCLGDTFTAAAETDAPIETYQWYVNGIPIGEDSSQFEYEPSSVGVNTLLVIATDAEGCIYEAAFDFEVLDCTDPCFGIIAGPINVSGILCRDSSIGFSTGDIGIGTDYLWIYGDDQIATMPSFNNTFTESGFQTIVLEISNDEGCLATDSITIFIEDCIVSIPCESIYVPNAFSPNDDQINDTFKPLTDCPVDNYTLRIFSRWGGLVFQTNNFDAAWDGRLDGKILQPGVYAWIMEYSLGGGERILETGDVTIMR